jgi:hypothetical protein
MPPDYDDTPFEIDHIIAIFLSSTTQGRVTVDWHKLMGWAAEMRGGMDTIRA